jgi:hypothetical protein
MAGCATSVDVLCCVCGLSLTVLDIGCLPPSETFSGELGAVAVSCLISGPSSGVDWELRPFPNSDWVRGLLLDRKAVISADRFRGGSA